MRYYLGILHLGSIALTATAGAADLVSSNPAGCFQSSNGRWLRGNTHAHSISWLRGMIPHGDSGAAAVARWYRDKGYEFLVISDHNEYTDPNDAHLRNLQNDEFILIPGVEITSDYRLWGAEQAGEHAVHSTAVNVRYAPSWHFENVSSGEILQTHIDRTRAAGGITIVNHPNYRGQTSVDDLRRLEDLRLMEIHNSHPSAKNHGNAQRLSTIEVWDALLTAGHRIYGIAADDAHHFKLTGLTTHVRKTFALPGSAWVMVNAPALTREAIVDALLSGRFYSTTGLMLETLSYDLETYELSVDMPATLEMLADPFVAEGSRRVDTGREGVWIEFIGAGGEILQATQSDSARLSLRTDHGYVRAKVTWVTRMKTAIDETPVLREFTAWTQPVFLAVCRWLTSPRDPAHSSA